ncbi:MAG TPA: SIS domain-containing protein [Pyrinomonadaceae bacterium]|jgi:D-sedoheptulose 7-phosphate isomerase
MEKIVFTNGCFDIIHPGHIDLLERARALGTKLIVGINSDKSVRTIKGVNRPFVNETDRKTILESLKAVDEVRIFDETTPARLIEEINPDVLVKGGDWAENEIIGADFVLRNGGEVFSMPLKEGFSSSRIVEKIKDESSYGDISKKILHLKGNLIENSLNAHVELFKLIAETQVEQISDCAEMLFDAVSSGNKILICGNGGSAADAQHIAAEFVGRYETERVALPAIALTTDTSALTALANDYGFEKIFARQVEAHARPGDVLIAISTSGNSPNVISAVMRARANDCKVIGLTGASGKKLAALCDNCILIPAERTARIQEAHITIGHIWCEIIDERLKSKS